jgi:hypothetical protein
MWARTAFVVEGPAVNVGGMILDAQVRGKAGSKTRGEY